MAINWKLKTYLFTKHSVSKVTAVQKLIAAKTGVTISKQNLCNYLNEKPKALKLETIEILCTAFDCKLSDFCEVIPSKKQKPADRKLSFKNTPLTKRGLKSFPDPSDY